MEFVITGRIVLFSSLSLPTNDVHCGALSVFRWRQKRTDRKHAISDHNTRSTRWNWCSWGKPHNRRHTNLWVRDIICQISVIKMHNRVGWFSSNNLDLLIWLRFCLFLQSGQENVDLHRLLFGTHNCNHSSIVTENKCTDLQNLPAYPLPPQDFPGPLV
jgi:hypothetical protein